MVFATNEQHRGQEFKFETLPITNDTSKINCKETKTFNKNQYITLLSLQINKMTQKANPNPNPH